MILIGESFSTYLAMVEGEPSIVKTQDVCAPGRQPVLCYREALGYRIGTRLGLPIPPTRLGVDPRLGRISLQHWVANARHLSAAHHRRLATTRAGFRIVLFDLLCDNHDRRPENLIQRNGTAFAIDFNAAFGFRQREIQREIQGVAEESIISKWFGIDGALALEPADRAALTTEVGRLEKVLDPKYLHCCVRELPAAFLAREEKEVLLEHLLERRRRVRPTVERWWNINIAPLHDRRYLTEVGYEPDGEERTKSEDHYRRTAAAGWR